MVARDVFHLESVGGQSGDFVAGFPEEGQHSAHPGARVEDGLAGAVDPLQQFLGVAELGALDGVEADRFRWGFGVVEVAVVQEVAGEHAIVEEELGVRMHGGDAPVGPAAADPADDVMRQQGAPQDLPEDPGAAQTGWRGRVGW